jgi:GTP:adenosylcobinamide-phosphate guanylyltransferase
MNKEDIAKKTIEVINTPSNSSNSDLQMAMDIVQKDFETVKNDIIKLTYHLDSLEETYNKLLKEYNTRNGVRK